MGKVTTSFKVDEELIRRVKAIAREAGLSMSEVVKRSLEMLTGLSQDRLKLAMESWEAAKSAEIEALQQARNKQKKIKELMEIVDDLAEQEKKLLGWHDQVMAQVTVLKEERNQTN